MSDQEEQPKVMLIVDAENATQILIDNGYNIARPIHQRRDLFTDGIYYSQAEADLCIK